MDKKAKKELTLCIYCKNRVKAIESHLQKCPRRKEIEYLKHLKRIKKLGGYPRTPAPSRSSSKSKAYSYSSWKTVIEGGAVETNKRRH